MLRQQASLFFLTSWSSRICRFSSGMSLSLNPLLLLTLLLSIKEVRTRQVARPYHIELVQHRLVIWRKGRYGGRTSCRSC